MRSIRRAWLALAVLGTAASSAYGQEAAPRYGEVLTTRLAAQQEMSAWLTSVLGEVAHPYHVLAAVEVVLDGELRPVVEKESHDGVDMKLGVKKKVKLPGLPTADKNIGAPGMSVKMPGTSRSTTRYELDTTVTKIALRLFVDEDMPAPRVEQVTALATTLAGIESARGDSVEVIPVSSLPGSAGAAASTGTQFPMWIPILISATLLLSALAIATGLSRGRGGGETKMFADISGGGGAAQRGGDEASDGDRDDSDDAARGTTNGARKHLRAFTCLAEVDDDDLFDVLMRLEPETAAVVLDQVPLAPELQQRLLEELPQEAQLELAAALGTVRVIPTTQLRELESAVEDTLTLVRSRLKVGSEDRLAELLEQAPQSARDRLIAQLAETRPELGDAIRGRILVFEDIESLPQTTIRQIVAELDPTMTARALHGAPAPVRDAVMNAVSRRLRSILTAEADGLGDGDGDSDLARRAVEDAMRRLHRPKTKARSPRA